MKRLWDLERRLVDRARTLVAKVQPMPTPGRARNGPLLLTGDARPLNFVAERPLVQPDATSCGSASLTMLRMLRDPSYASVLLDHSDPELTFANAALAVRRRTNAARDASGSLQLPWPAALGTRPAAMVRLLQADEGYGAPGTRYRNVVIDPADPDPVFDAILDTVRAGEPVALYIGDQRWMQHIVLVVRAAGGWLSVYDPAVGHEVMIIRGEFRRDELRVAGWQRAWLAILAH